MKKYITTLLIGLSSLLVQYKKVAVVGTVAAIASPRTASAAAATAGLPISQYPNNGTPNSNALFVMAVPGVTNQNISFGQLALRITNSINSQLSSFATTNYVNAATNALTNTIKQFASNLVVVLAGTSNSVSKTSTNGTNFYTVNNTAPGFERLEVQTNTVRLGLVTNLNWIYGMTGSVSGSTAILGIDDSLSLSNLSNSIFGQITTTSNTFAFNRTNQWTTNISDTPVNGKVWFQGFPSQAFVTNNARNRTWEWEPTNQSMRIGSIGNVGFDNHHYIPSSNFWEAPNVAFLSFAFGSNHLVNAPYSTIAGGVKNLIYTNSHSSFIGGGTNNSIETNAHYGFIGGGHLNKIHVNAHSSTIGGGVSNDINGGSDESTIGGGGDNTIQASEGTIAGGINNNISDPAAIKSTIGGGNQNWTGSQSSTIAGGNLNTIFVNGISATIGGGEDNVIGTAPTSGSDASVIAGGDGNVIGGGGTAGQSVISGGSGNTIGSGTANFSVIGGGRLNLIDNTVQAGLIPGGVSNYMSQSYSFVVGNYGTNTDGHAGLMATEKLTVRGRTNATIVAGSHASPTARIFGAGNGNTNYTLFATTNKMYLGSSNVNISAIMRTEAGVVMPWTVYITNLSADTWGFSFSAVTNRVKWQSWMYGTNAPSVLTNNTLLRLQGESEGTNTLVTYEYFSPAL